MRLTRVDRTFLAVVFLLILVGTLGFLSASLSLVTDEGVSLARLYILQLGLGLVGGSIGAFLLLFVPRTAWMKSALPIYICSLLVTALVFIPGVGIHTKGAARWIDLRIISFQPAELLKIGTVFMLAYVLSQYLWPKTGAWYAGLIRFFGVIALPALLLLLQPDNGTLIALIASVGIMYLASGAPWRDIGLLFLTGIIAAGALVAVHPYILDRVQTFLDPSRDPTGSSYQIQQSLIAVGSGSLFGRGLGQSVQKFNYLPEPIGDSVFAVYAEEVGFVGSALFILLLLFLFGRGLHIAARAPDRFSGLLTVGLVSLIFFQSLLNIGAMLGVVPLTGLPLAFMSHGGTALLITLLSVGVIVSISQWRRA